MDYMCKGNNKRYAVFNAQDIENYFNDMLTIMSCFNVPNSLYSTLSLIRFERPLADRSPFFTQWFRRKQHVCIEPVIGLCRKLGFG
jgi:hypothetical protein